MPLEVLPQIICTEDTWLSWYAPVVLKDGQGMWVMVDQVWIHGCDVTGESLKYRMEPGVRGEGRQVLYSLQMLVVGLAIAALIL